MRCRSSSRFRLTNPKSGDISKVVTSRMRTVVAVALALSVFAILVSPYAASELMTLRTPHKVRPPAVVLPLALQAPLAAWVTSPMHGVWDAVARLVLPGSEVVALTCAWLC